MGHSLLTLNILALDKKFTTAMVDEFTGSGPKCKEGNIETPCIFCVWKMFFAKDLFGKRKSVCQREKVFDKESRKEKQKSI